MPRKTHRRRAFLFLAAVLLPSAVLVGTTAHLIRQERELAVRRAEEERADLALQVGRMLADSLRRIGDRIEHIDLEPDTLLDLADSEKALLTLAVSRNGLLTFPWEMTPGSRSVLSQDLSSRHTRLLRMATEAEYQKGDFTSAAGLYAQAAEILAVILHEGGTEDGTEDNRSSVRGAAVLQAEARVSQARALLRSNRVEEAQTIFLRLSDSPVALVDQEGMPFFLYGIDGLWRSGVRPGELTEVLEGTLEHVGHLSLTGLLAWRELALEIAKGGSEGTLSPGEGDQPKSGLLEEVEQAANQRLTTLEALEELRDDVSSLRVRAVANSRDQERSATTQWLPYGEEPWMIGFLSPSDRELSLVAVVDPTPLLNPSLVWTEPPGPAEGLDETRAGVSSGEAEEARLHPAWSGMRLLPVGEIGGESLGPGLNGLRASFPPEAIAPPTAGSVEGWFFRLLLPVILVLTAFTAFLAWRDVRREAEAVRLRSQFVSSVTHELKTPLTSIRMFAETLRLGRHSGPETQREYLDTVVHETERLSRLINNVLDFARIERGEKTYQMEPTDVGAAAREAARAAAYPLSQGRYELVTEIADDLPPLIADSDALTQALLNLLSNAIKFSQEERRIDLRVLRDQDDLLLQVQDRGRGIAPHEREVIFRDFYRTTDAEEDGIPGTGLGLSLVEHVAKAHGGGVEVESQREEGSTFTIRIPINAPPSEDGPGGSASSSVLNTPKRNTP